MRDIAADRSGVPDLERGKKGAGAELKQGRRGPFAGGLKPYSSAMVQVAGNVETGVEAASEGQRSEAEVDEVSVAICGVENSQVPPASRAQPSRHLTTSSAERGCFHFSDGVQIHLAAKPAGCNPMQRGRRHPPQRFLESILAAFSRRASML